MILTFLAYKMVKGTVSRDGFFVVEDPNILISTFCMCADGFQSLSKAFHYLIQLFAFLNSLILKMLTETLLKNPLSVIGRCSLVPTTHWLQGKCARINFSQAASGIFTESQAAFCKHFQCQNRHFRVFEVGYWKDFLNY